MKKYVPDADEKMEAPEMPSQIVLTTAEVRYLYRFESTVARLEQRLHYHDEPKEIALDTMDVARSFYDADWCGLISGDLNAGIFYPYWWINRSGHMPATKFEEFEFVNNYDSWLDALINGKMLIIDDVENRKDQVTESEYKHYLSMDVQSVIGIPLFYHRRCGFIVVKNPRNYLENPQMLSILGYVVLNCWKEQQNQEAFQMQMKQYYSELETEKDVYLKLFGEPELHTLKGQLSASTINSAKGCRLLAYLALHRKRPVPIRTIAEALNQEEDIDHAVNSLRVIMSRLKPKLDAIMNPHHIFISSTEFGYHIDPYYHVIIDTEEFEKLVKTAEKNTDISPRIAAYKKAIDLYCGPLYKEASSEHWILSTVEHYAVKYLKAVLNLLIDLNELKDYAGIQYYAAKALELEPNNEDLEYWLIIALVKTGSRSSARSEYERAEENLSKGCFQSLQRRLLDFENGSLKKKM